MIKILGGALGGALPRAFPVIDRFMNGVATSTKSFTEAQAKAIAELAKYAQQNGVSIHVIAVK